MSPNISGTTHDLEASFDNGATFQKIDGVDNISFDTTDNTTTREFIDGTALEVQTAFRVAMNARITYLNQVNLDKILGSYMYDASAALDSMPTATLGTAGGLKLGLARTVQPTAIIRLRPKITAQENNTLTFVNATVALGEPDYEDNLLSVSVKISSEEAVIGKLTFA